MRGRWFGVLVAALLFGAPACGDDDKEAEKSTGGADMSKSSDGVDSAIEQSHAALGRIINGDPKGYEALFSQQDDVSLGNPFGPFASGRQKVVETLAGAAGRYRDGETVGFDLIARHVTDGLACVVEVERYGAKVGGSNDVATIGLRVTSVFRPEDGAWKLVHRHADPITTPQSSESIIPK
jgi:ketosteroid isomerase-like protein